MLNQKELEKMLKGNVSKRRNPLIADLLCRIHMVESWGRGMPLILKNAPDVKFREIAHIFIAAFDRPSFADGGKLNDKAIDKAIDKDLSTTERAILDLIVNHPAITQKEMAIQLGLSEAGIRYHTDKLKEKSMLQRVGGKKSGHWVYRNSLTLEIHKLIIGN